MARDVIFVPGLPGSHLFETGPRGGQGEKIFLKPVDLLFGRVDRRLLGPHPDRLGDPDPIRAGEPIRRARLLFLDFKQAQGLYDVLERHCGVASAQIHPVGWDWRRPVADAIVANDLAAAIQRAPSGSVLIAHSTGGLVARSVLEAHPALCDRLSAVVAIGVPWIGTLKSLAVLVRKESLSLVSRAGAQRVLAHSCAAMDLLPRADAGLTIKGNGQAYDLFGSVDWLPASPPFVRHLARPRLAHSMQTIGTPDPRWSFPVDLHNVAGFGEETTVSARIAAGEVALNVSASGSDLGFDEQRHGDGTIPFVSASSATGNRVSSWIVPIGAYRRMGESKHSQLWKNPGAIKALRHVIADTARESLTELALDTSAYSPRTRIRLRYSVHDAAGSAAPGRITVLTPARPGLRTDFETDPRGFGSLVLRRGHFQSFRQGSERKRRVHVELRNLADDTTSEIFALVPA